jgi:hypothetical protein
VNWNHNDAILSSFFLDLNECLVFGTCSHQCINMEGSYKCVCDQNFQERNNTCIAKGKVIIIITKSVIILLYMSYGTKDVT